MKNIIKFLMLFVILITLGSCDRSSISDELQISNSDTTGLTRYFPTCVAVGYKDSLQVGEAGKILLLFSSRDEIDSIKINGKYSSLLTTAATYYTGLGYMNYLSYDIKNPVISPTYKTDSVAIPITVPSTLTVNSAQYLYYNVVVKTKNKLTDTLKSYMILKPAKNDASIYTLSIGGTALSTDSKSVKYSPSTYSYTYYVNAGGTVPAVTATKKSFSGQTIVITQASSVYGTLAERTALVKVTAKDGTTTNTYSIEFDENPSDSLLSSISVNSTAISAFASSTFKYSVATPTNWDYTSDLSSKVTPTLRSALNQTLVSKTYSTTDSSVTIVVSSKNGKYSHYKVKLVPTTYSSTYCSLASITINGTKISAFSASTLSYSLKYNSTDTAPTVVGTIDAAAAYEGITISYPNGQVPDFSSSSTSARTIQILVTAKDGKTTNTYNVIFYVE